jgi:hypothetical protein
MIQNGAGHTQRTVYTFILGLQRPGCHTRQCRERADVDETFEIEMGEK